MEIVGEIQFEKTIEDMEPGDSGYCVPWAYDPESRELDTGHTIHDEPGGTVEMKVECFRSINGGRKLYRIHAPKNYRYSKGNGREVRV